MIILPFLPFYIFFKAWKAKNNYEKVSPRLEKGEIVKELIGFDFGENFKLRETSSNKYREYLIDLEEADIQSLKEFCENQNEGEFDRNNNETNSDIFKEIWKIKSQDGCILYTQINHYHAEKRSCEIDFKNNTIKYIIRWC